MNACVQSVLWPVVYFFLKLFLSNAFPHAVHTVMTVRKLQVHHFLTLYAFFLHVSKDLVLSCFTWMYRPGGKDEILHRAVREAMCEWETFPVGATLTFPNRSFDRGDVNADETDVSPFPLLYTLHYSLLKWVKCCQKEQIDLQSILPGIKKQNKISSPWCPCVFETQHWGVMFLSTVCFPLSASCIIASDFCWNTSNVPQVDVMESTVHKCWGLCGWVWMPSPVRLQLLLLGCHGSCTRCQPAGRSALLHSTQLDVSKLCYILLPLWNIVLKKYSSSTFWEMRSFAFLPRGEHEEIDTTHAG